MIFRNLEKIRSLIKDATDLDVMYAYDDLVFPEHAAFLIQFDDTIENNCFCYFHEDCIATEQTRILAELVKAGPANDCTIEAKGLFNLKQNGEEVDVHFL